jgi:alpha-mannosidase
MAEEPGRAVWRPRCRQPEMMHLYGVGDHGGGPTRTCWTTRAAAAGAGDGVSEGEIRHGRRLLRRPSEEARQPRTVPTVRDELYFEYHRGVQTTQAETKKRIRRTEDLLLNAEKFSSLASAGRPYPQATLDRAWKRLLFDEFPRHHAGLGNRAELRGRRLNLEDVGAHGQRSAQWGARKHRGPRRTPADRACRWWCSIRWRGRAPK